MRLQNRDSHSDFTYLVASPRQLKSFSKAPVPPSPKHSHAPGPSALSHFNIYIESLLVTMAGDGIPPPPPPAPIQRGPTPGGFRPPPPPPGFRPQGGPGPQGMPMQMPMRPQQMPMQNGTRISNITQPKVMDESDAKKLLTTWKAYTIRKAIPNNPKSKTTWAISEVVEERLSQSEIAKIVKRLDESKKTVSQKKIALMPNQTGQVDRLMDDLISSEHDPNFEWALVQLDSFQKDLPARDRGKRKRETVTITVYAKRAPLPDKNPVVLFHHIERMKIEREKEQREHERMMMEAMRPRPPPPPPQPVPQQQHPGPMPGPHPGNHPGPGAHGIINVKNGGGHSKPKIVRDKRSSKNKYRHDSDTSSETEYSDSELSETGSFDSSKSSASSIDSIKKEKRRHSVNRGPTRSRSRHRPELKTLYRTIEGRSLSPSRRFGEPRRFSEYGSIPQRPYAPEVPHMAPHLAPTIDPISSAYQAGKEDARAERFGEASRAGEYSGISQKPYAPEVPRMAPPLDPISSAYQAGKEDAMAARFGSPERPVQQQQPVIIVERRQPVITYDRPERRHIEPRLIEPPRRFLDEREHFVEDYPEEDYVVRRQEAEEYIARSPVEPRGEFRRVLEPRQFVRRQSSPVRIDRYDRRASSPGMEAFGRRPSIASPLRPRFNNPNPFTPIQLPRSYTTASTTDSYDDRRDGW